MSKLTPAAKAYARALVKRWKQAEEHVNCVHPGQVVRMADIVLQDGTFGQRPFSIETGEIEHNRNCGMATIIQRGYCVHNNYVGDPFGPDILCGLCEYGDEPTLYEKAVAQAREQQNRITRNIMTEVHRAMFDKLREIHTTNSAAYEWMEPGKVSQLAESMSVLVA